MTNRVENAKDLTAEQVNEIATIVRGAITEPFVFTPLNGCARVYMHIGYANIKKTDAIAKAINNIGPCRVTPRPGQKGVTFYMGYDNARGNIYSAANHIAKRLKESGYIAFIDCDGD